MDPDETTELGEPEPITDANYRDGWDSVATDDDELFDQIQPATVEAMNARPTKTLSDDR